MMPQQSSWYGHQGPTHPNQHMIHSKSGYGPEQPQPEMHQHHQGVSMGRDGPPMNHHHSGYANHHEGPPMHQYMSGRQSVTYHQQGPPPHPQERMHYPRDYHQHQPYPPQHHAQQPHMAMAPHHQAQYAQNMSMNHQYPQYHPQQDHPDHHEHHLHHRPPQQMPRQGSYHRSGPPQSIQQQQMPPQYYQQQQYAHGLPSGGGNRRSSYPPSASAFHRPPMAPQGALYPPPGHHRQASITPSSQMSTLSLREGRYNGVEHCDSQTPSPPAIPPPPTQFKVPLSAPAKLRAPIASRLDESLEPLRESRGRLNVLHEEGDEERDEIDRQKSSSSDERDDSPGMEREPDESSSSTARPTKKKAAVTIQDASLLLGLRTSSSTSSPATVQTLEDKHSTDEDDDVSRPAPPTAPAAAPVQPYTLPARVPKNYPTRLALPEDESKLNSLHCFIRAHLLEIFVVAQSMEMSPTHRASSSVGRVGLRCVHCAIARKRGAGEINNEAPMAVFYPKCVSEIYRLVTSWQRCHLRKCRNVPPPVRAEWDKLRETDKTRGKTVYWVTSAQQIGLIDCQSRAGGVRFRMEDSSPEKEETVKTAEL